MRRRCNTDSGKTRLPGEDQVNKKSDSKTMTPVDVSDKVLAVVLNS